MHFIRLSLQDAPTCAPSLRPLLGSRFYWSLMATPACSPRPPGRMPRRGGGRQGREGRPKLGLLKPFLSAPFSAVDGPSGWALRCGAKRRQAQRFPHFATWAFVSRTRREQNVPMRDEGIRAAVNKGAPRHAPASPVAAAVCRPPAWPALSRHDPFPSSADCSDAARLPGLHLRFIQHP